MFIKRKRNVIIASVIVSTQLDAAFRFEDKLTVSSNYLPQNSVAFISGRVSEIYANYLKISFLTMGFFWVETSKSIIFSITEDD